MVSTRSADLLYPLLGKPIDRLQKSINRTCDEVVFPWQKVAQGSSFGYTCYMSLNTIKARSNMF